MSDPKPLISLIIAAADRPDDSFPTDLARDAASVEVLEVAALPTPAEAWNEGLRVALGEWVGFASASDRFGGDYLATVADFLATVPDDCSVVSTSVAYVDDETDEVFDTNPLRKRFRAGSRVELLDETPLVIPPDVVGTFVRRSAVLEAGLEFDAALSPFFDSRHFLCRLLLAQSRPQLGLVAGARYEQRRIMDKKVAVAVDPTNPRRFSALPDRGYLDVLRRVQDVPAWLADTLINDLRWYVVSDARGLNGFDSVHSAVLRDFGDALGPIVGRIGVDPVWSYDQTPMTDSIKSRLVSLHEPSTRPPVLVVDAVDPDQSLMRIAYSFGGTPPHESFSADGMSVTPNYAKFRRLTTFGLDRVRERILWLPESRGMTSLLDGRRTPITLGPLPKRDSLPPRRARRPWRRSTDRFRDAWILMDRATLAGDNAEHLYRHVAADHDDINAWFVLERSSRDWQRLADEGFRLVEFRSADHRELLSNAIHYASSHIDPYVFDPFDEKRKSLPTWKFTFLQHGVTKDDVSDWFNGKRIDRLVTATRGEQASIVADGTRYRFTEHESRLTGFPRHDGLLRKAATRSESPDLVTFMPTWRQDLAETHRPGQTMKGLAAGFAETEFARRWSEVLASGELRESINGSGLNLAMMPHPNLAGGFDDSLVPSDVMRLSYEHDDVQEVLSRTALLITDYSSVAFDAAYIDRAVLYYQFDRDRMFGEGHFYRPGYFNYEENGFGPIAVTADQALAHVKAMLADEPALAAIYRNRRAETFPTRDGNACSRVVDSMRELRIRA